MTQEHLEMHLENAIHIIDEKDYETVSPAFLQRSLGLEFTEGMQIFKELVGMGIITKYWLEDETEEEDDESANNFIGQIDKAALKRSVSN